MVTVSHLWKVFGPGAPTSARAQRAGADRARDPGRDRPDGGVRDVTFDVGRGETFVVMGLSGSGKSTLVRCIARLERAVAGFGDARRRDLLAMDDARLREIRRTKMSMVFQHFGLFPHRRVIDNVAYGLEVQGIGKATRRRRAGEVLETVGLTAWADALSAAALRRHAAAGRAGAGARARPRGAVLRRAVLGARPADPPGDAGRAVRAAGRRCSACIVFITHDFAEALRLGDRIAIMKDGVFDQVGTPEEIVAAPATDYVREFTTDVPKAKVLTARVA